MPRLRLDPMAPNGVSIAQDEVRIVPQQNGYVTKTQRLGELTDVKADAPTNGQALAYQSSTATWIPQTISGGGGGTGTVDSVVAGTGITVNSTDPANPIVASSITQYTDALAAAAAPVQSVAGKTGTVTLVKADVGLGNVDNTSDATKNSATATLTNKTLTSPKVASYDGVYVGADKVLEIGEWGGAGTSVNYIGIEAAAAGTGADIYAAGADTNIDLLLNAKGTGKVKAKHASGSFIEVATISDTQTVTNKDLSSGTNTFPTFNQNTSGSAAKWTTPRTLAGNSVDGSANVAFTNKFIVQGTADTGLSAAQFLGALTTGILKVTTTTGVLSTAVAADFPTLNQSTTGSAATLTTSRNIDGQAFNGSANITVIAPGTHAATSKTTPVDADELPLVDSATSNVLAKLTWANLKAGIKSYYDSVTSTLTNKTLSTGSVIDANVTVTEVLKKAYPVGSIYTNASDSTNPGTLLGFGTWSAFAAGRVPVGKASSGTFVTAGGTGGEETHILTTTEMPSHTHDTTATLNNAASGTSAAGGFAFNGGASGTDTHTSTSAGSGGAHNNIQPYIVVYMWQRTA